MMTLMGHYGEKPYALALLLRAGQKDLNLSEDASDAKPLTISPSSCIINKWEQCVINLNGIIADFEF